MSRANYLPAPHAYNLQLAACVVVEAYGPCVYLVGSCLEKRDYRDVDIRAILDDADFDRRFPKLAGGKGPYQWDPEWSLTCAAISQWLETRTGLPIDFQIQRQTQANEDPENDKKARWAIGLFRAAPANPDMIGNACLGSAVFTNTGARCLAPCGKQGCEEQCAYDYGHEGPCSCRNSP